MTPLGTPQWAAPDIRLHLPTAEGEIGGRRCIGRPFWVLQELSSGSCHFNKSLSYYFLVCGVVVCSRSLFLQRIIGSRALEFEGAKAALRPPVPTDRPQALGLRFWSLRPAGLAAARCGGAPVATLVDLFLSYLQPPRAYADVHGGGGGGGDGGGRVLGEDDSPPGTALLGRAIAAAAEQAGTAAGDGGGGSLRRQPVVEGVRGHASLTPATPAPRCCCSSTGCGLDRSPLALTCADRRRWRRDADGRRPDLHWGPSALHPSTFAFATASASASSVCLRLCLCRPETAPTRATAWRPAAGLLRNRVGHTDVREAHLRNGRAGPHRALPGARLAHSCPSANSSGSFVCAFAPLRPCACAGARAASSSRRTAPCAARSPAYHQCAAAAPLIAVARAFVCCFMRICIRIRILHVYNMCPLNPHPKHPNPRSYRAAGRP